MAGGSDVPLGGRVSFIKHVGWSPGSVILNPIFPAGDTCLMSALSPTGAPTWVLQQARQRSCLSRAGVLGVHLLDDQCAQLFCLSTEKNSPP